MTTAHRRRAYTRKPVATEPAPSTGRLLKSVKMTEAEFAGIPVVDDLRPGEIEAGKPYRVRNKGYRVFIAVDVTRAPDFAVTGGNPNDWTAARIIAACSKAKLDQP